MFIAAIRKNDNFFVIHNKEMKQGEKWEPQDCTTEYIKNIMF